MRALFLSVPLENVALRNILLHCGNDSTIVFLFMLFLTKRGTNDKDTGTKRTRKASSRDWQER